MKEIKPEDEQNNESHDNEDFTGDRMTLDHFIECCKTGLFIDYDGFGRYATETEMTHLEVRPSQIMRGIINRNYSHVVWFNR